MDPDPEPLAARRPDPVLRSRLRGAARAAVVAGAAFLFCWIADRYRLSPGADLTAAEALSLRGVRWAYVTEHNGESLMAVPREPFDPLHFLGLGSAAVYVFDLRSNRLVDWTVDVYRDERFEQRQQFTAGRFRRIERDDALRRAAPAAGGAQGKTPGA